MTGSLTTPSLSWPEGRSFAFTIFDDADSQTFEASRAVYGLLEDCGLRTTKSVWPRRGPRHLPSDGATCDEPEFVAWAQGLQQRGFEIAYHMAASHTSSREETIAALNDFARHFGGAPKSAANHYNCDENLYWGSERLTGPNRLIYRCLNGFRNGIHSYGHIREHPYFWGDLCRTQIKYVRNFVFGDINTLRACPLMPYHDPLRPFVNYWFASSEGANAISFADCVSEANQDRLEAEGGACIMYTHFGLGFFKDGSLDPRFRQLMKRLSKKNGWFVPVSTLLDFLMEKRGPVTLDSAQRLRLERSWLWHKIRFGSA
jgi:hypothetical protein